MVKGSRVEKESNFISAIIYLDDKDVFPLPVEDVVRELDRRFENYEIIFVDDGVAPEDKPDIAGSGKDRTTARETIVSMGKKHGLERSMNAGIDCAVGDYVLEIDDIGSFDPRFIGEAYGMVTAGHDIVFGTSKRSSLKGAIFYPLFNRFSRANSKLATGSCRLVSRRAVNRVHSMSEYMPYRKAAYAASGLSVASLPLSEKISPKHRSDFELAVDSLAIYTDMFYRVSIVLALFMALLSVVELVYTIVVFVTRRAVEGWPTMMLVLTGGLFGLFTILAFVVKYLSLISRSEFNKQNYMIEGVRRV